MIPQRGDTGLVMAGGGDTIVALATPAGRSAIAVVRVSGPDAHAIAGRITSPWPIPERSARLCLLQHADTRDPIDRGIVTVYGAGRSYTGEAMVEIATHGGLLVPAMAMAALIAGGAREALPGEFTRRAVLNGKLDLVRAEAVGDLIDARSRLMHRTALMQLDGGLSQRIEQLRRTLIEIEALIAYEIDFPEEDDGPISRDRVLTVCDDVLAQLVALLATAPQGQLVREGAIVVLAGAPNAGKSSLYNALLGEARAIVTDIPGTTRDALEATIDADGWPLRLIDTAGLCESGDALERLGIEMSERYLAQAHVVLACGDTMDAVAIAIDRVRAATPAPVLGVLTKADIVSTGVKYPQPEFVPERLESTGPSRRHDGQSIDTKSAPTSAVLGQAGYIVSQSYERQPVLPDKPPPVLVAQRAQLCSVLPADIVSIRHQCAPGDAQLSVCTLSKDTISVSARTGEGLAELRTTIVAMLGQSEAAPAADLPLLTRARHVRALASARAELGAFREAWAVAGLPAPVAAVHLREAIVSLETLIGAVDVEDVLDRVFSTFCVGK